MFVAVEQARSSRCSRPMASDFDDPKEARHRCGGGESADRKSGKFVGSSRSSSWRHRMTMEAKIGHYFKR